MARNPTEISQMLSYPLAPGHHDEVFAGDGSVHGHWDHLLRAIKDLGLEGLQERDLKARRILRDDGATYNVYEKDRGRSLNWRMDPIPFLVSSEDWSAIESGLQERAELFNLILSDLYGERDLIRKRILPADLILGDPAFLRACVGVRLPGNNQLIFHAADLARTRDGTMCVLGDRTQNPSGAGYALENRIVTSRVLPSLFRDSHVHRLALFFRSIRSTLTALAPWADQPRVVILTPGFRNETYFEHAYLANYLGYDLVQGEDLTVRDGFVWLKSLGGLQRVDVILRRVDDVYCDPLEFRGDSHLGVAGLLEVARDGRVCVVNTLGSAILENPALLRYLPAISRYFLGHELHLPSVETWWCGDPADLDHVLANLPDLVIKPTHRPLRSSSIFCDTLSGAELDSLRQQILAAPRRFVAQATVTPSSVPTWNGDGLQPKPALLRSYAVADEGSFAIMPGGLTRVGMGDSRRVSNQSGSISKDTWVLASEPERQVSLLAEVRTPVSVTEQQDVLPSRVAENMFWMARYAERAETTIRLLRTVFIQLGKDFGNADAQQVEALNVLLGAVTQLTLTFPGFTAEGEAELLAAPQPELLSLIIDSERSGTVSNCIHNMLAAADAVQEQLSADTQRVINDIRDEIANLQIAMPENIHSAPEEALDPMVSALMALTGLLNESTVRDMGWRFMKLGRRLERVLMTTTLIRSTLVNRSNIASGTLLMESLLLTAENLITYRRRFRGNMQLRPVLELLLLSRSNPRSLMFQLEQVKQHAAALPHHRLQNQLSTESKAILEANMLLELADLEQLIELDSQSGRLGELDQCLTRIHHLATSAAAAIAERYFDHTAGPQQLVRSTWDDEL